MWISITILDKGLIKAGIIVSMLVWPDLALVQQLATGTGWLILLSL